jgi:hypothetical protein
MVLCYRFMRINDSQLEAMTSNEEQPQVSTIQETVATALRNSGREGYLSYAQPVIAALEDRERGMAEALMAFGADQDLDEDTVRDTLAEAGMTLPEPEPEPEQVATNGQGGGDVAALLSRISERLDTLEGVARSRGLI